MAAESLSVLLWGAGEHGCVVAEYARCAGWTVVGYADADAGRRDRVVDASGARVLLSEEELLGCLAGECVWPVGFDRIVPTIGDNATRLAHAHILGDLLAPALVHPSAVISPTARIGNGTVVCPLSLVNTEAELGQAVIVNSGAVVGHNTRIGDGVHVGPGAVLAGSVQVGARTFVGTAAAVIPGVQVGADVTVGAGSVVLRDVPDGVTAVGVPVRLLESIERGNASQTDSTVATASVRT